MGHLFPESWNTAFWTWHDRIWMALLLWSVLVVVWHWVWHWVWYRRVYWEILYGAFGVWSRAGLALGMLEALGETLMRKARRLWPWVWRIVAFYGTLWWFGGH